MKVAIDKHDRRTAYALLDAGEFLTDAQEKRARKRARELGAQRVEVYRGDELVKVLDL